MRTGMRARIALGWIVVSLGGCGGLGTSAEDRINAAMPVGSAILVARDALEAMAKAQSADVAAIESEYAARLKVRALECGHGYAPGLFADNDAVRAHLTDTDCFTRTDQQLQDWLGLRRVGLLLAAPPLRAIPKTPAPMLVAPDTIVEAAFAARAGVALVKSQRHYQLIDMGSGDTIHQGDADSTAVSLSPNGRLFLLGHQSDAQVVESETGAVLATFPGVRPYQFHWAHDVGAFYASPRDGSRAPGVVFRDFTTGRESPIPMSVDAVNQVFALPGDTPRFAVFGWNKLGEVALTRNADAWEASLRSERVLSETTGWSRDAVGLTADGNMLYGAGQALQLMPLASLQLRNIPMVPLRVQRAVATPDPDQLLLSGYFTTAPGAGPEHYLYSIRNNTLARIDATQLLSTRLLYIPTLRRNAVIDDSKIVLLDHLPAAAPLALDVMLSQREQALAELTRARELQMQSMFGVGESPEMARARALVQLQQRNAVPPALMERMLREQGITPELLARAQRANAAPATIAASPQPYAGPIASLAANAQVEAIGVYEGGDIGHAHGASARTGTVQVRVRRSPHPLVLALSAYEPVRWVLTVEPGARLAAVLSSGYSDQEVLGAGNARVLKVGQLYAYKRGSPEFTRLDDEVARWTGKRIGVFQGSYSGTSYTVGGP